MILTEILDLDQVRKVREFGTLGLCQTWKQLRDFPYINPNTAALNFAKGNSTKVTDANGAETTLGALYDTYIASPITNPPAEAVKKGHRAVDVGDATAMFDQVWTEVKGGQ
jgi:hypothetical protein